LVLFSRDVLKRNPNATVISEVKCSQRLYDDIAKNGGQAIMWKAGHSLLKAKMKETGALLAGEMSGHMFFKERYFGFDDAIYASLRLLEILAKSGQPLSRMLADLPASVSTPEIRVDCPDDKKFIIAAKATEYFRRHFDVVDVDGVRVKFSEGWGLIRASNTQPALVLRFEARSESKLAEYRALIENKLAEFERS
ncbi:MAG: phosphomannomutase, partial [Chloroflexota bacterium]